MSEVSPSAEIDAGLTTAEREALAHAIEDDLYGLSSLNETGAPSAHWFGWFLLNKGNQHLVPEIERIIAARTRVLPPGEGDTCTSCGHLRSIHVPECEACPCPHVYPPDVDR